MKNFFLKIVEFFLNKFISFFNHKYCPVCKKIVLRTVEGRRGKKIEGGEAIYFQKKCPLCKKMLEEAHALNSHVMKRACKNK